MAHYITQNVKYLKLKPTIKLHTNKLSDYKLSFNNNATLKEHDVKILDIDTSTQDRYVTLKLDEKDLQLLAETNGYFLLRFFDEIVYRGNYVNNLNDNIDNETTYKESYLDEDLQYNEPYI